MLDRSPDAPIFAAPRSTKQLTYLATLPTAASDGVLLTPPTMSLNGVAYPYAVANCANASNIDCFSPANQPLWAEWDLQGTGVRFTGIAGISDRTGAGAKVRLEVLGDGRSLFSTELSVGSPQRVDVAVGAVRRLRVQVTPLNSEYVAAGVAIAAVSRSAS